MRYGVQFHSPPGDEIRRNARVRSWPRGLKARWIGIEYRDTEPPFLARCLVDAERSPIFPYPESLFQKPQFPRLIASPIRAR